MRYEVYEREDDKGFECFDRDWKELETRLDDLQLALFLNEILELSIPPINPASASEVLNSRYEIGTLPIITGSNGFLLYAFDHSQSCIHLLALQLREGHFAACEKAYKEACVAFGLVNPSRERIDGNA